MEMASPAQGRVTCNWREYKGHAGIDIGCPNGTPVYAAFAGVVIRAGWNCVAGRTGYGIVLRHPVTGEATYYGHLLRIGVAVGQSVSVGQQIGLSGSTGNVTGPHLHFEVWGSYRDSNTNYDPRKAFNARGITPGSTQGQRRPVNQTPAGKAYYRGAVDGVWGAETTKAVQSWLKDNGFYLGGQVDGVWGPLTVGALQEFLRAHGVYNGPVDGVEGPGVVGGLQIFLKARGFYRYYTVDGRKGAGTVSEFQSYLSR